MKLLLAPHNDDETLFCSYTIMREKPIVIIVTDSHRQEGVTSFERREETINAMEIFNVPVFFLGIFDSYLNEDKLTKRLCSLNPSKVYAPSVYNNGNPDHNIVGKVAKRLWNNVISYSTYELNDLELKGDIEIKPSEEERVIKNLALQQYKSQLIKNKPHFDAVKDKSEYYEF